VQELEYWREALRVLAQRVYRGEDLQRAGDALPGPQVELQLLRCLPEGLLHGAKALFVLLDVDVGPPVLHLALPSPAAERLHLLQHAAADG